MTNIMKKIPEKSKKLWNRIKTDWTTMNLPEKVGLLGLAVVASPALSLIGMEGLRRYRDYRERKGLSKVV
jgi:hypothetical protein